VILRLAFTPYQNLTFLPLIQIAYFKTHMPFFPPPFSRCRQVKKDKAYLNKEGVALNSNDFVLSKESVGKAAD
jgi:hypothetical protein